MKTLFFLILIILNCSICFAARPSITSSTYYTKNVSFGSDTWELMAIELEFDQDLYLQDRVVCPYQDLSCEASSSVLNSCRPCDFTDNPPLCPSSSSSSLPCCQQLASADPLQPLSSEWCEPSLPFTALSLGQRSAPSPPMAAGETAYYRFFIPESDWCKPIRLYVRPIYGALFVYLSASNPYPASGASDWWIDTLIIGYGVGQSVLDICPTFTPGYAMGTVAVAVVAQFPSQFTVELFAGDPQPILPQPPVTCADVVVPSGATCVNDGETFMLPSDIVAQTYFQIVVPYPAGCHVVGIAANPLPDAYLQLGADPELYCIPLNSEFPTLYENSAWSRWRVGPDYGTLTICSDQVQFLSCGVQPWTPGDMVFTSSSVASNNPHLVTDFGRYDFGISAGIGSAALFFDISGGDPTQFPIISCVSWTAGCDWQWATYPGADPLQLLPAPLLETTLTDSFFPPPPPDSLLDTFSPPQPNKVVVTLVLQKPLASSPFTSTDLLPRAHVFFNSFASSNGEPPEGSLQFAAPSVPWLSLAELDIATLCHYPLFESLESSVLSTVKHLKLDDLPTPLDVSRYVFELYTGTSTATFQSCKQNITALFSSSTRQLPVNSPICGRVQSDPEFESDPCCNSLVFPISCCAARGIVLPLDFFSLEVNGTAALAADGFRHPECAQTYLSDLSLALNQLLLPDNGCTDRSDTDVLPTDEILRTCRQSAGIGYDYTGVSCITDSQCPFAPHRCNRYTGVCMLPLDTRETETLFLSCLLDSVSIAFLDYLKTVVLQTHLDPASPEFLAALYAAASLPDCMGLTLADTAVRNNVVWDASDACKAGVLGLDYPAQADQVHVQCPTHPCLDHSCFADAQQCIRFCLPEWTPHVVEEADCPRVDTCLFDDHSLCDGPSPVCAYCPDDYSSACTSLDLDQTTCQDSVACELPSGEIIFGLTSDQCLALPGECSIGCYQTGCHSYLDLPGACIATDATSASLCASRPDSLWFQNQVCILPKVASAQFCATLSNTVWEDCATRTPSTCGVASDIAGNYLECFTSPVSECPDEASCVASGECSDHILTQITFDGSGRRIPIFGACVDSGYYESWIADRSSECLLTFDRTVNGCLNPEILTPDECQTGIIFTKVSPRWQTWLTPATSEAECLDPVQGRYGCLVIAEKRGLWLDEADCENCGGLVQPSFDWTPGTWRKPIPRPLTWIPKPNRTTTQSWRPALNFFQLETWVLGYLQERASLAQRSSVICSFELLTTPLFPLVCDRFSTDPSCFGHDSKAIVSITNLCIGESVSLYTPTAIISVDNTSVPSGCVKVSIEQLSASALTIPPQPPSVTFQLATLPSLSSYVQSPSGNPVGTIQSSGQIFKLPGSPVEIAVNLCIAIANLSNPLPATWTVPDFATGRHGYVIHPLLLNVTQRIHDGALYWCGDILIGDGLTVFAVVRAPTDQWDAIDASYSDETLALTYLLAALYSICLGILVLHGCYTLSLRSKNVIEVLPIWFYSSLALIALCVFRIVYLFAYPSGTWENNEVANFIVFELPTFLYLTAFILLLGGILWILQSAAPDSAYCLSRRTQIALLMLFALMTWLLFIATSIAVGILAKPGQGPCPGRVSANTDSNSSQIQALSIAYQSIVISFAVILVLGFLVVLKIISKMDNTMGNESPFATLVMVTLVVATGFIARCILFIIILAVDFTSTIYLFFTLVFTEVVVITFLDILFFYRDFSRYSNMSSSYSSSHTSTVSPNKF